MHPAVRNILASACFLGSAGAASAQQGPVSLHDNPAAQERAVVDSIYGDFEHSHPGMHVQTAMVDLQGKGLASVVARFVSPATCTGPQHDLCETVVLRYVQQRWSPVFEHALRQISVAPSAGLPGSDGVSSLTADGVRWIWSGYDHFMPDVASLGQPFAKGVPATADISRVAQSAMMANPDLAMELKGSTVTSVTQIPMVIGSNVTGLLVSAYGPGVCSDTMGCPSVVMVPEGGSWRTLWTGFAAGAGAVMPAVDHSFHEFALEDTQGYQVYGFDGTHYRQVQTSYPSPVTPSP